MARKRLTVLGSTGSIGTNTLAIVRQFPDQFQIVALSCHTRVEQLLQQIEEFHPQMVCVGNPVQAQWLAQHPCAQTIKIFSGENGLKPLAALDTDLVVAGIVGSAGLRSTFEALEAGHDVALANKETLVLAGELILKKARERGSTIFPVDSEHNAIFQARLGHQTSDLEKIILTASGGPFLDRPVGEFANITLAEALSHPNWDMGNKITIDSATMMNKGLEVIEAQWLFNLSVSEIEVVIHRESIVHSLVEYKDGSFIAQLGLPDMRTPIAFCLAYPHRLPLPGAKLKMADLGALHFEPVPPEKFPCLRLALQAAQWGGAAPAVLNGANEAVVAAYLAGNIQFLDISQILTKTLQHFYAQPHPQTAGSFLTHIETIDDALHADQWGRTVAQSLLTEEVA